MYEARQNKEKVSRRIDIPVKSDRKAYKKPIIQKTYNFNFSTGLINKHAITFGNEINWDAICKHNDRRRTDSDNNVTTKSTIINRNEWITLINSFNNGNRNGNYITTDRNFNVVETIWKFDRNQGDNIIYRDPERTIPTDNANKLNWAKNVIYKINGVNMNTINSYDSLLLVPQLNKKIKAVRNLNTIFHICGTVD